MSSNNNYNNNNFAFGHSQKKLIILHLGFQKKRLHWGFISNIKLSLSILTLLIDKMANMSLTFSFFFFFFCEDMFVTLGPGKCCRLASKLAVTIFYGLHYIKVINLTFSDQWSPSCFLQKENGVDEVYYVTPKFSLH